MFYTEHKSKGYLGNIPFWVDRVFWDYSLIGSKQGLCICGGTYLCNQVGAINNNILLNIVISDALAIKNLTNFETDQVTLYYNDFYYRWITTFLVTTLFSIIIFKK